MAGEPLPWQLGLQAPASPVAQQIDFFHDVLMIVITVITIFVLGLLLYACWRFRAAKNPTPSTTTHNTLLEILWTAIPVVILVIIAIPSIKLLYYADRIEDGDMTLKVVGHQWYWEYQYPDHGNLTFDANMIPESELKPGQRRLMETDNPVVLPAGRKIRLLLASSDVLHNWAVPALGVRLDNVPGRLNETWVEIDKPGKYYGFCSELCGVNHSFMPIMIQAVPPAEFDAWAAEAQKRFARSGGPPVTEPVKIARNLAAKTVNHVR